MNTQPHSYPSKKNATKTPTEPTMMMNALSFQYKKDAVAIVQAPRPTPAKGQVLVQVEYAALDTALDAVIQRTWIGSFVHKLTTPLYLGWHYAGTVAALGPEVTDLQIGDAVFGSLPFKPETTQGSFADYITVKTAQCAKRPAAVAAATAAAGTIEPLTALQALRDLGHLQSGQTVLVVGAGGGVGSAAVQIAKAMGAHVTAICSARDAAVVKTLGADVVLSRDMYPHPLVEYEASYDVILDTPVVLRSKDAFRRLTPKGHLVSTLPSWALLRGLWMKLIFSSKTAHMVEVAPTTADLEQIAAWMVAGQLTIPIDSTHKVKDMPVAMARQRERKNGRVVIQVQNGWK
jgi:NADPH:quinone reductase-like Zn-dependent oxidoreductase